MTNIKEKLDETTARIADVFGKATTDEFSDTRWIIREFVCEVLKEIKSPFPEKAILSPSYEEAVNDLCQYRFLERWNNKSTHG